MKTFTLFTRSLLRYSLLVLLLLQVTASFGQLATNTTSWKGTSSDDWNTASNWTNGLPSATIGAVIGGADFTGTNQPVINENGVVNVASIKIQGSNTAGTACELIISNDFQVFIAGTVEIGAGTTLENNGTDMVVQGDLTSNGSYKETVYIKNNGRKGRFYPSLEMTGSGKKIAGNAPMVISHLKISGSIYLDKPLTIRTMDMTVQGQNTPPTSDLTVAASGTFDPKGYKVTFVGKGASATTPKDDTNSLLVEDGGTLRVMAATYLANYEAASATNDQPMPAILAATSVVNYAAGTDTTQTVLARTYGILKISRGGTKVLNGTTAIDHTSASTQLIVESGTLDLKTYTLDRVGTSAILGGTLTVANGATLRIGGTNTFPTGFNTRNLGSTSIVEYYGQNQVVSNELYGNLHLTCVETTYQTKTMPSAAMTISGYLKGSGYARFTALGNITVNGDVTLLGNASFNGGATALTHTVGGNWKNDADFTGGLSTVILTGTSKTISRTVAATLSLKNEFYNLTIAGSDAKITLTPTGSTLTINGNLATTGAGTLTQATESLTMAGATTGTISGTGIVLNDFIVDGTGKTSTASFTVNGDFTTKAGGSFTATAGTITLGGASKRITTSGSTTFFGLRIFNTDNKTNTSTSFTINSNLSGNGLTADLGSITFGGATATIAGTHNLYKVNVTGTDRKMVANANLGIKETLSVTGTLDVTTNIPNTITYNGTSVQSILGRAYNNIVFANIGVKTADGALTVNGNLTISSGSNFNAGTFAHTLNGNWINSGSFTASTSTIIFAGTSDATVSGSSNTVFNILTVAKTATTNNVALSTSATTRLLNLTSGWLRTGDNSVTVTENRSGDGWIVGTIIRTNPFVIGTDYAFAGPYNLIKFSGVSGITSVTVKNSLNEVSTFIDGTAINRQYEVSVAPAGTYAGEIQLQYDDADLNGNTEANLKVYQDASSNGAWSDLTFTSRETTQNWVRKTGVTSLTGLWTLSSSAGFKKWTGASTVDNLWTTKENWYNNEIPTNADIAVLGELGSAPIQQPEIRSAVDIKGIQFKGNNAITLTMGTNGSLAVQGNISASGLGVGGTKQHYIIVNDKNIAVNGNLVLTNGSSNNVIDLTIGAGTVSVAGSINQNTGSDVSFTGNGNLKIKGDYSKAGTSNFTTSGTGTVTYEGANAQVVAAVPYHNLTITKASGVATLESASALTLTGNLIINGAGTTALALPTLNVDGKVDVSSGTLSAGSSTLVVKGNWSVAGGSFVPGTSTVNFTGGNAQSVSTSIFNHLTISKATGTTLTTTGNVKINADLTIQSGTISLGVNTMDRSAVGGTFTLANGATLELGGNNFPANFNNNTLGTTSTVHYNGTVAQTVAPVTYGKLTFSNGASGSTVKTLVAATTVVNDLIINSGATLDANSQTLTISGNLTSSGSFIPGAYTDNQVAPSGTLVLASTGGISKSISGTLTVNNFVIQPSANYSLLNNLTINGNIDIVGTGYVYVDPYATSPVPDVTNNGILDAGLAVVSVAGDFKNSGILKSSGSATFLGVRHQTIQLLAPMLPGSNGNPTVIFDGTVSPTLNSTRSPQFATVYIKNKGGVTASVGWVVGGEFIVESGATFDGGPYTHTFYTTFKNSGIFKSSGLINFTPPYPSVPLEGHPFKFGDTDASFVSTGTVRLGGTKQILLYGTVPATLNNLIIGNTVGITPTTLNGAYILSGQTWKLTGNLTIESGAVLNAIPNTSGIPNKSFTIGGNLVNNGYIVSIDPSTKSQIGAGADFIFSGTTSQISGTGVTTIGGLTVASGAKLDVRANITMFGSLKHEGTAFSAQGAELTFAGVYPATISTTASIPLSLEYLKIGKTGATTAVTLTSNIDAVKSIVVGTGTLDISNKTITQADGATGITLVVADAATVKVGGTSTLPATEIISLAPTSTVEYYGTNQQVKGVQYGNLTLSNIGAATFEGTTALIAGSLTVAGETGQSVTTPATVDFNGTGAQIVAPLAYQNLKLSNAGTKTFAAKFTKSANNQVLGIAGALTKDTGVTVDADNTGVTVDYNGTIAQTVLPVNYYNLTLSNTGTKTITGTTGVAKNLISTATQVTMEPASIVDLNGPEVQTVAGLTYKNLRVSATGDKTLSSDATIEESLSFTVPAGTTMQGATAVAPMAVETARLVTGSYGVTLGTNAVLTGETETSHVLGTIKTTRAVLAGTKADFGGLGIAITPEVAAGNATMTRVTGTPVGLNGNSIKRYFRFQPETNAGKFNAVIEATYLDAELTDHVEADLQLYSARFLGDGWTAVSTNAPVSNKIQTTGINSINYLTFGTRIKPLPVEIVSFTATKSGNNAVLTWTTASEQNNQGFEVQASADGYIYQPLGFVASKAGSSSVKQEYSFTDSRSSKNGIQYYRLKQIDIDGTTKYYGPKTVNFGTVITSAPAEAYPNPFSDKLRVSISSAVAGQASVKIYTNTGKLLKEAAMPVQVGINDQPLELGQETYVPGLYMLVVELHGQQQTIKLIKK